MNAQGVEVGTGKTSPRPKVDGRAGARPRLGNDKRKQEMCRIGSEVAGQSLICEKRTWERAGRTKCAYKAGGKPKGDPPGGEHKLARGHEAPDTTQDCRNGGRKSNAQNNRSGQDLKKKKSFPFSSRRDRRRIGLLAGQSGGGRRRNNKGE